MKLCELVRGYKTSDATLATARAFAEEIGKTCIVVNRDVAGFVTTRLIAALVVEAVQLVESGVVSAEDLDLACKLGFGHAMGPLATTDLTGVDVLLPRGEEHPHRHRRREVLPAGAAGPDGRRRRPGAQVGQGVLHVFVSADTGRGLHGNGSPAHGEAEAAAAAGVVHDGDRAAVPVDDPAADGQAEARPAVPTGQRGPGGTTRRRGLVGVGHADAPVGDLDPDPVRSGGEALTSTFGVRPGCTYLRALPMRLSSTCRSRAGVRLDPAAAGRRRCPGGRSPGG